MGGEGRGGGGRGSNSPRWSQFEFWRTISWKAANTGSEGFTRRSLLGGRLQKAGLEAPACKDGSYPPVRFGER